MTLKARGCILLSEDTKRILLQLRSPDRRNKNYWGFWGGGAEGNETPVQTIERELSEEIGFIPDITKFHPLHRMVSNDESFEYNTFLATVPSEFIPQLNHESEGYAWVNYDRYPVPLHPGVKLVLQNPRIMSKIKTIVDQL
jgi:8-oxo-dGTP pyrophosphatase MutT (NUDIX family)|tara:strand:+ start:1337 stop:1759 length:423 start_codon:yes stop_codon:yes gene_type:complete